MVVFPHDSRLEPGGAITVCPTSGEDGLAMGSGTPIYRERARLCSEPHRTCGRPRRKSVTGTSVPAVGLRRAVERRLADGPGRLQYASLVRAQDLQPGGAAGGSMVRPLFPGATRLHRQHWIHAASPSAGRATRRVSDERRLESRDVPTCPVNRSKALDGPGSGRGKGNPDELGSGQVLHEIAGKDASGARAGAFRSLSLLRTIVVVGHQAEDGHATSCGLRCETVLQEPQLGTGHAAMVAAPRLREDDPTAIPFLSCMGTFRFCA